MDQSFDTAFTKHTSLATLSSPVLTARSHQKAKPKWGRIASRIMQLPSSGTTWRPVLPLDDLDTMKSFFTLGDDEENPLIDEDTFVECFSEFLAKQLPSQFELQEWFRNIDINIDGSVSWQEFTSYVVDQSRMANEGFDRARRFTPCVNPDVTLPKWNTVIARMASHDRIGASVVAAGYDGFIRVWDPTTCRCKHTINNASLSPSLRLRQTVPGLSAPMHAGCTDVVFNPRGTHCFISGTDKAISVYEVGSEETFQLSRLYLGITEGKGQVHVLDPSSANSQAEGDLPNGGGSPSSSTGQSMATTLKNSNGGASGPMVDTTILNEMPEIPTSIDVSVLGNGREVLYVGQHNGSVIVYPTMRRSRVGEVDPMMVLKPHRQRITKVRYIPQLRGMLTASWDTSLVLTDIEGGLPIATFGGSQLAQSETSFYGHTRVVSDFAFSSQQRLIASCGGDREVMLWVMGMACPTAVLEGHGAPLISLSIDGSSLMSLDVDNILKVWDLRTQRMLQSINTAMGADSADAGNSASSNEVTQTSCISYHSPTNTIVACGRSTLFYAAKGGVASTAESGHGEAITGFAVVDSADTVVTTDSSIAIGWNATNGRSRVAWEASDGSDQPTSSVCGVATDMAERKACLLLSSGEVLIYNHRNAQRLATIDTKTILSSQFAKSVPSYYLPVIHKGQETMPSMRRFGSPFGSRLNEAHSNPPIQVAHVSNGENTARYVIILYAKEFHCADESVSKIDQTSPKALQMTKLLTMAETQRREPGKVGRQLQVAGPHQNSSVVAGEVFTSMIALPASGKITCGNLLLGTSLGRLLVFSPVMGQFLSKLEHPIIRTNRFARNASRRSDSIFGQEEGSQAAAASPLRKQSTIGAPESRGAGSLPAIKGSSQGLKPQAPQPVEDMVVLFHHDLVATVLGDNKVYLWDLHRITLKAYLRAPAPLLCLAAPSRSSAPSPYARMFAQSEIEASGPRDTVTTSKAARSYNRRRSQSTGQEGSLDEFPSTGPTFLTLGEAIAASSAEARPSPAATALKPRRSINFADSSADMFKAHQRKVLAGTATRSSYTTSVLVAGDDSGCVYLFDTTPLGFPGFYPPNTGNIKSPLLPTCLSAPDGSEVTLPLLSTFRVTDGPLHSLGYSAGQKLVFALGAGSAAITVFSRYGDLLGDFGQPQRWNPKFKSTFKKAVSGIDGLDIRTAPKRNCTGGEPPTDLFAASASFSGSPVAQNLQAMFIDVGVPRIDSRVSFARSEHHTQEPVATTQEEEAPRQVARATLAELLQEPPEVVQELKRIVVKSKDRPLTLSTARSVAKRSGSTNASPSRLPQIPFRQALTPQPITGVKGRTSIDIPHTTSVLTPALAKVEEESLVILEANKPAKKALEVPTFAKSRLAILHTEAFADLSTDLLLSRSLRENPAKQFAPSMRLEKLLRPAALLQLHQLVEGSESPLRNLPTPAKGKRGTRK